MELKPLISIFHILVVASLLCFLIKNLRLDVSLPILGSHENTQKALYGVVLGMVGYHAYNLLKVYRLL
jgi:hypothetical protein